jgi:hypothetical protein
METTVAVGALFLATAMLSRGAYAMHLTAQRGRAYLPMDERFFWALTTILFFGQFLAPAIGFVFLPWPWVIAAGVGGFASLYLTALVGGPRVREAVPYALRTLIGSCALLAFAFCI